MSPAHLPMLAVNRTFQTVSMAGSRTHKKDLTLSDLSFSAQISYNPCIRIRRIGHPT